MKDNMPISKALWVDCETDEERVSFLLLGRAHETGIVALAIQNEVAMAFKFRSEVMKERITPPQDTLMLDLREVRAMQAGKMAKSGTVYETWYNQENLLAAIAKQLPGVRVVTE